MVEPAGPPPRTNTSQVATGWVGCVSLMGGSNRPLEGLRCAEPAAVPDARYSLR